MGHQEDIVKTESKIIVIRDTQVILDRDVAELYGVETRDINKAVKNNPKKFPPGYIIELNSSEKQELVENFHRFNTLKHSTVAPHAFTEQGLYMLATILKGDLAISTTIAIIDTFTQLRKLARTIDKVNEDAKEHGILPDKATEGKNICFFRYAFLVLGVSFVGNATSCLYSLTFSDSIQAQNLCKSLAIDNQENTILSVLFSNSVMEILSFAKLKYARTAPLLSSIT